MKKVLNRCKIIFLIAILIFLSQASCDEIFEKDISGAQIILVAPGDSCVSAHLLQTFLWEVTEGAAMYNLQIATPSFKSVELLLADTMLADNRYSFRLFPGMFEWRVRALNGSSGSDYFVRKLQIDTAGKSEAFPNDTLYQFE